VIGANLRITKNKTVISLYLENSAVVDYRQKLLLMSDVHFDSRYCDRKLLKRDLETASRENAFIFIAGDFFDAMQGRKDMRGRYDELLPEYKTDKYFDVIVEDAATFLKPYQKHIIMFGYGNHETSVIRHQQTDILSRLVGALNSGQEHKVQTGGYGGWVRFMFHNGNTPKGSVKYRYHHGKGASAFASDGIMEDKRQAATAPDADIVHSGHNHNEYVHTVAREVLNNKGIVEYSQQVYIRTPGYKSAYIQDEAGLSWEYATMGAPKPLGSVWVTIGFKDTPKVLEVTKTF
jgi:predicted phosphodiesterase